MKIIRVNFIIATLFILLHNLLFGQSKAMKLRVGVNAFNIINTAFYGSNYVIGANLQLVNDSGNGPYFSINQGSLNNNAFTLINPPKRISDWHTTAFMVSGGYNWELKSKQNPAASIVLGLAYGHYSCAATGQLNIKDDYFNSISYKVPFSEKFDTYFFETKFGFNFKIGKNFSIEPLIILGYKDYWPNSNNWKFDATPLLGNSFKTRHGRFQIMVWYLLPRRKAKVLTAP